MLEQVKHRSPQESGARSLARPLRRTHNQTTSDRPRRQRENTPAVYRSIRRPEFTQVACRHYSYLLTIVIIQRARLCSRATTRRIVWIKALRLPPAYCAAIVFLLQQRTDVPWRLQSEQRNKVEENSILFNGIQRCDNNVTHATFHGVAATAAFSWSVLS